MKKGDLDPSNESSKKCISRRRIRKVRRLLKTEPKPTKEIKNKKNIKFTAYSLALIILFVVLLKNEEFRKELKRLAMNQFQLYLHGRENYCDEPFEHWHISNTLNNRIIGQDDALENINIVLQQHERISAMAFVGTSGIGKTLALNLIQEHFQWHLNVRQYIWSSIDPPGHQFTELLKLIKGLTTCGQNAIFIDNIPMKFIHIIDEFNQKLLNHCNENHIKLIVIYVFQISNAIEAIEPVQLDKVKTIRFRQFNSDDIHNCITMESDRLKIDIQPNQIDELLQDIDAKRHGCKLIAAKIVRL